MCKLRIFSFAFVLAVIAAQLLVGKEYTALGADGDTKPAKDKATADADGPLTIEDIQQMRRQRKLLDEIADTVAERGRGFEVTDDVVQKLRGLGFRPAQIDAIKESSPEPLVPGRLLDLSDEARNQSLDKIKKVTEKSGIGIKPFETQHVTLWSTEEMRRTYLPDIQKLEKYFHTHCAEPIRSGLDKRSTHIIVLKDHVEFERWCRAMFDLFGDDFTEKDMGGSAAHFQEEILKGSILNWWDFCVFSVAEQPNDLAHRNVATNLGRMYFGQLTDAKRFGALQTGFANGTEAIIARSPSYMYYTIDYQKPTKKADQEARAWLVLAKSRINAQKDTPLGKLFQLDISNMEQPHYAEGWTLVGLLNLQPDKFGELLLELREGGKELEAIEKVYGWDEKKLTTEWHSYVLRQK